MITRSKFRRLRLGWLGCFSIVLLGSFSLTAGTAFASYYKDAGPANGAGGGIGRPGSILSPVRVVNGKNVCGKTNDHPQKSDHNSPNHIDSECCLDPDEIPNSNCYYSNSKYQKYIEKYLAKKK